jgi:hypothetical protein
VSCCRLSFGFFELLVLVVCLSLGKRDFFSYFFTTLSNVFRVGSKLLLTRLMKRIIDLLLPWNLISATPHEICGGNEHGRWSA